MAENVLPDAAENNEDKLLLKNDFAVFKVHCTLVHVRLSKSKLLMSNFIRKLVFPKIFNMVHFWHASKLKRLLGCWRGICLE